jgi:integrase
VDFTLSFIEGGRRSRRVFADLPAAKAEAKKIVALLDRGEHRAAELTTADAAIYHDALKQLAPTGVSLHSAVSEFVNAVKHLDGHPLGEVAKDFAVRNRSRMVQKKVAEVVVEILAERKRQGRSARYLQSLRSHLDRFKDHFEMNISSVTTLQIEAWLFSNIGGGPRTRNNIRTSLVTLFHFARQRGYLPRGVRTEADELTVHEAPRSQANVYSPEELKKILEAADARVLPFIAIGAFSGLRAASIMRLRWEDIKWTQRVIEIPAAIAKNRKRYLAPLLPCLNAWLAPYRRRRGLVVAGVRLEENLRELFRTVGIKRLHNGLRDSFISYRVAITKNLPQVAFEAGNSVEMIRSKYLEARTNAEAKRWFAVRPEKPANVTEIGAAA